MSFESPITIAATAAEICARFNLERDAKNLLRDGMDPREFATALVENKMCADAIEFMAHALPAREGIWWGCLCMQRALGENLSPPDRAAATAAVRWVKEPIEENRVGAKVPADAAPPPSIAGSLAMAAYQCGGSVAPPGSPFRAPAPFAPATGIALAVKLASIKTEPIKIARMQRSYVELAIVIAEEGLG